MSRESIFAWSQSILALIVVIGSGVLLYTETLSAEAATGVVGIILGYFFGNAVAPVPLNGRGKAP